MIFPVAALVIVSGAWLQFNAGCPERSPPLIRHNLTTEDFIGFDVELRGLSVHQVVRDEVTYTRFSPGRLVGTLDSTGLPELPFVPCFVPVPDDCGLSISVSACCDQAVPGVIVYPAPLDSTVVDDRGYRVEEFFRRDSIAYASEEWYPSVHAELAGEFRLRDQRIAVVNVYPVQCKASDDSLRVWSDVEVMVRLEDAPSNWELPGLDSFDRLAGDRFVGYTPSTVFPPLSQGSVFRHEDMVQDPPFVPDYVIVTAGCLDGQWIDSLAAHRASLNGFGVLTASLDDIFSCYGGSPPWPTSDDIRDYMEFLWNFGGPGERPTYLLLIGDVHVPYDIPPYYESWYLPATEWGDTYHYYANDDWYAMFNYDREVFIAPADMIVGRLSARTPENVEDMIALIIEYEDEASSKPPQYLEYRRMLTRLAGTDHNYQITEDHWKPTVGWTDSLRLWMGYDWDNYYCGDGSSKTLSDGSTMSSADWVQAYESVFSRGSQLAFYTDHGHFHYFSAGLDWCTKEGVRPNHLGAPDSVFSCINVDALNQVIPPGWVHLPPFVLLLCCTAGTFNHTEWGHYYDPPSPPCYNDNDTIPPIFDFGIATLDESFIKNTKGGAIGVFGGSLASPISSYDPMGRGIMESVYHHGVSRTGDAITRMRLTNMTYFWSGSSWRRELSQFNLLGDPAVDIGDRVLYPDSCDLVISPSDVELNRYPTRRVDGSGEVYLHATVRNAGAAASGAFDVSLSLDNAPVPQVLTVRCGGLAPGEETTLQFDWADHSWFTPPGRLLLTATADPREQCPDSWRPNNTATAAVEVIDFYPNRDGWPIRLPFSTKVPAVLADMTDNGDLEVVVLLTRPDGKGVLQVYDASSSLLWGSDAFCFEDLVHRPVPVVGNVHGDSLQIVVDTRDALLVFDLSSLEPRFSFEYAEEIIRTGYNTAVLADLEAEQDPARRDEIVVVRGEQLMVFDIVSEQGLYELAPIRNVTLPDVSGDSFFSWPMAANIRGDETPEILVQVATHYLIPNDTDRTHFFVYDYAGDEFFAETTLAEDAWWRTIPAVGEFQGEAVIAVTSGKNSSEDIPAMILDATVDTLPIKAECEHNPSLDSDHVLCCMMTDWTVAPGFDRVIANAENQAITWDDQGDITWYGAYTTGVARPPLPALGDLTKDSLAEVVTGTREGLVFGYDHNGDLLLDLGFPYVLPAEVCGGFVIADIDGDGVVELVFGTMDNHLHVWELGECEEGYAPWPQAQGNARRTGVLQ